LTGFGVHCGGNIGGNALNGVAELDGVHCGGNGVADDDDGGIGLKKPLAVGASSDKTALKGMAPEPLAVVATAGLPELALSVELFMILSLDA
jgi:hypothetical protein